MIYFDNAATTFYKPPAVIDAAVYAMKNLSVNPGRSGHRLAVEAAMRVMKTRQLVADFVGAENSDNVIFCPGCTQALNLAVIGSVKRGCHVISSLGEHNSVLRPLFELKQRRLIDVTFLVPDGQNKIDPADVEKSIRRNTTMIVLGHVSNVTGAEQDIAEIGAVAKRHNAAFIVDGAQSVGYTAVDMRRQNIDMLAFPAHKGLHGIMGVGCLCFGEKFRPQPIIYGGTGTDSHMLTQPLTSPEGYESGTQNLPGILALGEAIKWHLSAEPQDGTKRREIAKTLYDGLCAMKNVTVMSSPTFDAGIVSFYVDGQDSQFTADLLSGRYDIAVRGGLHCAPLMHRHLGTEKQGLVRASVSAQNTAGQALAFLSAVRDIAEA